MSALEQATGGPNTKVAAVTSAWDEDTVTWATRPAYDSATPTAMTDLTAGISATVDVTALAADWVADPAVNHGIALVPDTSFSHVTEIASGNHTDTTMHPTLQVAYRPFDDIPPTVALTLPGAHDTITGAQELAAIASDAESGVSTVEYLVDEDVLATESVPDPDGVHRTLWDSTDGSQGLRLLTARATDGAGNVGATDVVPVTVINQTTTSEVSVFVLDNAVPLTDVEAALRAVPAVQPVSFDHQEPRRGGLHTWDMTLDAAVASTGLCTTISMVVSRPSSRSP